MKTQEIKIASKTVTLAYCYATEIGYEVSSGEKIEDFMKEAAEALKKNKLPNIRKCIWLITAAAESYAKSQGIKDGVLEDIDLLYVTTPQEMATALVTVIALRGDFYYLPAEDAAEAKKEADPKND